MSKVIEGLYYAATHEWVRVEGDTAVVGITDHAQEELTDVVYVEPPKIGKSFAAKQPVAVVESVKAASDIYSPLSGEVHAVNKQLESNPALVNADPFGEGWIYKLKLANPDELKSLLDAGTYQKQIGST